MSTGLNADPCLAGMVSKKTLVDIVRKLLAHLEQSSGMSYRYADVLCVSFFFSASSIVSPCTCNPRRSDEVVAKIVEMCSQGHYQVLCAFVCMHACMQCDLTATCSL